MRTPCDPLRGALPLAELLAALDAPSCEEREAEVDARRLSAWANAMAAHGYRHSVESLEALRLYLAGYGLLLMGGVGTGKTHFFRTLGRALAARGRGDEAPVVRPMVDTVGRRVDEVRALFAESARRDVVLDDVGAEPVFNEYGSRWDVLPWIVEMRLAASGRTHFTTNLAPKELERRYGARTVDRMHEMAASATLAGPSRRRTTPNAAAVRTYAAAARRAAGGEGGGR